MTAGTSLPSLPRWSLLILAVLTLFGALAAGYLVTQPAYTIYVDGAPLRVAGTHETVGDVLAAAGVTLRPEDRVEPGTGVAASAEQPIQVLRARPVTVRTEAGSKTYWTLQRSVGAFLAETGLHVERTDQLAGDGQPIPFAALDNTSLPDVLEIGNFVTVTIDNGERQQTLRTAAQTVGGVLQEAGITIYGADGVEPPLGTWLSPGLAISVRRSMPLTIRVDGRVIQTRSHHTSARDVLAEAGIGLVGLDFVRPGPDVRLKPGDIVEVVRVTEDFRLEDQPIPYETRWQPTDQLEIDSRALLQSGAPGIMRQRMRVRYENGVEVSQTADAQWVAREPVDEIIGYGTQIVVRAVETPEGYLEYWRVVRMRVTSYTAASSGKPPDHPAYGITASGLRAGTGIVAVDPRVVPFRTWVYVPGYGTGYAGDTGGGVKGRWIDLGYSQGEYRSWSGYVDVYYLTPVPEPDDINYLIPTRLP
jgi:resuscitation-promoting factor RpfB